MYGVGPVPALKGLSVEDTPEAGKVRRTRFVFRDFKLALVDNAGVSAHVEQKLYTFPEGLLFVKGWVANLTILRDQIGATNGVSATWSGIVGLGSVQSDGTATLTSTEVDYIGSTAVGPAVAGQLTAGAVGVAAAQLNDTGGAASVWLNLLVNDADQDVTTNPASLILNGEIVVNWELIGDK